MIPAKELAKLHERSFQAKMDGFGAISKAGHCLNCGAIVRDDKPHIPGCEVAYSTHRLWPAQLNDAKEILIWKGKQ